MWVGGGSKSIFFLRSLFTRAVIRTKYASTVSWTKRRPGSIRESNVSHCTRSCWRSIIPPSTCSVWDVKGRNYRLVSFINFLSHSIQSMGRFISITSKSPFQILETIPFDRVNIRTITIHLDDFDADHSSLLAMSSFSSTMHAQNVADYHQTVTRFLQSKSYKLVKSFNHNYIYQLFSKNIKIINKQ